MEKFENSMKILPSSRYEVCLPFKLDIVELPSKKKKTWNLHKMCKRAQRSGIIEEYKVVFREWETLEIIEKVEGEYEASHFLPHRPVVKSNSLTFEIKPVFDTSAHETGKNSLHDLLYKGPNLIK